jgi:mRNA interferase RelE/StbE
MGSGRPLQKPKRCHKINHNLLPRTRKNMHILQHTSKAKRRSKTTPRNPHPHRGTRVNFKVLLHPEAAKEPQKTEKHIRTRIVESAKQLCENPDKIGKPLKQSDFWSLRVGDYRVTYEINQSKNQVVILFVGHGSKVYDDFSKML